MEMDLSSRATSSVIPAILLSLEIYHVISHACILFRLRMLPRKDLVRVRFYFLFDLLTVASSAIYTRELLWLAALQNMQHAFFFLTWDKHAYCKRIIAWSSLDWLLDEKSSTGAMDAFLGTAFDMAVHAAYVYHLWRYLAPVEYIAVLLIVAVMTRVVLFNSRFAWSSPRGIPAWVSRRIHPLPKT